MGKQTYYIRISLRSRRLLDAARRDAYGQLGRQPLAHLFHKRYIDNRSAILKQSHVWSATIRPILTAITLSDEQVLQVLELAEEHDIDIRYLSPRTGGKRPTNLLGQFLEAILNGQLIPSGGA